MKRAVWISYDLGVKGDYPGLYKWLDTKKAKECGGNVAYFVFEYKNDIIAELKTEITKNVNFKNGDKIYLIYSRVELDELNKTITTTKGIFIIGNRRAAPWEGYAPIDENKEDF